MAFGSFNGAYPGHFQDMQSAKLIPEQNLWFAIYDFNSLPLDSKDDANWRLLTQEEEEDVWYPLGAHHGASNCCPRLEAGPTIPKIDEGEGILVAGKSIASSGSTLPIQTPHPSPQEVSNDEYSSYGSRLRNQHDDCPIDSDDGKSFVSNIIYGGKRPSSSNNETYDYHSNSGGSSYFGTTITIVLQKTSPIVVAAAAIVAATMKSFWNLELMKRGLCLVDKWFPCLNKYIPPSPSREEDEKVGSESNPHSGGARQTK